jgi:hypothetical protein
VELNSTFINYSFKVAEIGQHKTHVTLTGRQGVVDVKIGAQYVIAADGSR